MLSADIKLSTLDPQKELAQIRQIWLHLLEKHEGSFFLSWGWMGTWLQSLPVDSEVVCVVGFKGDQPCLAFFCGVRDTVRHKFVRSRSAHLNTVGDTVLDDLTIEYNDILLDKELVDPAIDWLKLPPLAACHEFVLPGIAEQRLAQLTSLDKQYHIKISQRHSYYIDLAQVRDRQGDYLSLLSSNKRSQIKRSTKAYEKEGPLALEWPGSVDDALAMLDELSVLHQREWQKRGKPGSFSSEYFLRFHRSLLSQLFADDQVHIVRVGNAATTLGYIYGFHYGNAFLYYQSGFAYSEDNKLKPGMTCHSVLIKHYADQNLDYYDFLAGDSQYKKSLSTGSNTMSWAVLQKPLLRFWLERQARECKRRIRG